MQSNWSGWIKAIALAVYGTQLVFLQLFVRLEPTMFGVTMPQSVLQLIDVTVHYLPALAFASTALLALLALYRSSVPVRAISAFFLAIMLFQEFAPGSAGWLYGSLYWLVLSVLTLAAPEVLLALAAIERRSIPAGAVALSSSLAVSFYIWSFVSRITFNLPPISLLEVSVYAFAIAFAIFAVSTVKRAGVELYISLLASAALMAFAVYFTASNVLAQKVVNMVLQTSLGAPTPLPWFAPLFFTIFFVDIYSFMVFARSRSSGPLSVAAGITMIFTSVYLPYNVLYAFIAFSGSLLVYFGLARQAQGPPSARKKE